MNYYNNNYNYNRGSSEEFWLVPLACLAALGFLLYWAGRLAAIIAGTKHLHGHVLAEFTALGHFRNPSAAWHANVGSPVVYWLLQLLALIAAVTLGGGVWWLVHQLGRPQHAQTTRRSGEGGGARVAPRGQARWVREGAAAPCWHAAPLGGQPGTR